MERLISLREANQHLSACIDQVLAGEELTITRRGQPVVRLIPVLSKRVLSSAQTAARERTRKRLRKGYSLGGAKVNRNEIYDR